MTALITSLIDKRDNMEIIRDEISAILALEIANQKALALVAGKDEDDFYFRVYTEKTNPWELVEDENGKIISQVPLVNVYTESAVIKNGRVCDTVFWF